MKNAAIQAHQKGHVMTKKGFWICWPVIVLMLAWGAGFISWLDQSAYVVGALIMVANIASVAVILHKLLHEEGSTQVLMMVLAMKTMILLLVVWLLPKFFSLDLFSLAVGIFTIAISAACVSVPFASNNPKQKGLE